MVIGYDAPGQELPDWTLDWPSTIGNPDSAQALPHLPDFFAALPGVRRVRSTYVRISGQKRKRWKCEYRARASTR